MVAVLVAVAAMFDPVFTSIEAPLRPVVVVKAASIPADTAVAALRERLAGRALIERTHANRLPCASDEDCVVIADGTIDTTWEDRRLRPVSMITVPIAEGSNVRVQSVNAAAGHRSAAGVVRVVLEGSGVEGKRTDVRVLDGNAVVGSVSHTWSAAQAVTLDVPWWPLDAGARALRIDAAPADGEVTIADNSADISAPVADHRALVLVFDTRPSWQSTFVRRALEADPRFIVAYRGRVAPSLTASTPSARLDSATLDRVALAIIGAPDALTAEDVDLLERFVRIRGGSLMLLPEQRPSGPAARLFDGSWTEHLSATAEAVGPFRAGEILRAVGVSPAATVLATSNGAASIVSTPSGAGRIIVAGAMDAWRFRTPVFDHFWRSLAADAAAAGEALTLTFDDPLAAFGSRVRFTVRDRRMAPAESNEASAVLRCNDGPASTVRLWPGGAMGEFTGEASADANGNCTIEASVGDRMASASVAVVDQPRRGIDPTLAKLERLVRSSGGEVAALDNISPVAQRLTAEAPTMSRVVSVYPMRSPWWMLPFAACLSIEWWQRRRDGLR